MIEVGNFKIWTLLLDLLDLYEKASKDGHVNLESFLELADNHGIQVESAKSKFRYFSAFSTWLQVGDKELEVFEGLTDVNGVVSKELFCQFAKVPEH